MLHYSTSGLGASNKIKMINGKLTINEEEQDVSIFCPKNEHNNRINAKQKYI